jgi:hypothetical protein
VDDVDGRDEPYEDWTVVPGALLAEESTLEEEGEWVVVKPRLTAFETPAADWRRKKNVYSVLEVYYYYYPPHLDLSLCYLYLGLGSQFGNQEPLLLSDFAEDLVRAV